MQDKSSGVVGSLSSRSLPSVLLAFAIGFYPFTASLDFGLGYYLYILPLVVGGGLVLWHDPTTLSFTPFRWLVGFALISGIVSILHAAAGYTGALRYPPIYVVSILSCIAFWQCLKVDRQMLTAQLSWSITAAVVAFLVFWLARDYALGDYYAYPCRVNQFAFWAFCSMILLDQLTRRERRDTRHWLLMIVLSFLAITTMSRAAALGVVLYWMVGIVFEQSSKNLLSIATCLIVLTAAFFAIDMKFNSNHYSSTFAARYQDMRLLDLDFFLKDRGYGKIFTFPKYLLFGAAEGQPERFGDRLTIHNSLIGPWFSYGTLGLICIVGFIRSTWRPTKTGWRVALALAPTLFFHDVTHLFIVYLLLIAVSYTANRTPVRQFDDVALPNGL